MIGFWAVLIALFRAICRLFPIFCKARSSFTVIPVIEDGSNGIELSIVCGLFA